MNRFRYLTRGGRASSACHQQDGSQGPEGRRTARNQFTVPQKLEQREQPSAEVTRNHRTVTMREIPVLVSNQHCHTWEIIITAYDVAAERCHHHRNTRAGISSGW